MNVMTNATIPRAFLPPSFSVAASPLLSTGSPPPSLAGLPFVVGVGVDIVHVPRIVGMIARQATRAVRTNAGAIGAQRIAAERFAERILHERELQEWRGLPHDSPRQTAFLARSWAVKEAAFKAISGVEHPRRLTWHDAFLTHEARRPTLQYTRELQEAWRRVGGGEASPPDLHLSISHDGEYVAAFVVAEARRRR